MKLHAQVVCVVAFALVVALPLAANEQPVKRAVLVGINDYTASRLPAAAAPPPPDRDWQNLDGAVRDVEVLRALLVSRYGFQPANIAVLTDQQATGAAILDALDRDLVRPAKKNDVIFFYYSGHGSQVRNSRSDEPDKLDESIVPADSRLGADDIRDKQLRRIFNAVLDRGARLTVLFDSCHSGSGARGFDAGLRPRSVKPDFRDVADGANPGPRPENRGALILAAAEDFDYAYETRDAAGDVHGAFSWAFENALRDAEPGEPAIDTFLRAQARLRLDMPAQEPVIAGNAEARLTPFLGARGEHRRARMPVAVEKIEADGTYVLQGGWVNGITVGSELASGAVRLEVTALRGIARCEARPVPTRGAAAPLPSGTLLDVVGWAAPPGRPLRVWLPTAPPNAMASSAAFEREAARRKIRWIDDPTESAATHLIRWRDGGWEMLARGKAAQRGDGEQLLGAIPSGSSLFVQLPAPAHLADAIDRDGIELTSDPRAADYILGGRFVGGRIEYAWLRRALTAADRRRLPLPTRSRWSDAPIVLNDAILRLRRIFGWQQLEAPLGGGLPYALAIRNAADGALVDDAVLVGQSRYSLVLRVRSGAMPDNIEPRYVYVFVIDSGGKGVLLFPLSGSVENRLPLANEDAPAARPPREIALGDRGSFRVTPPFGVDTYFLLTTDEALPNPWCLEWDGVRGGGEPHKTALEELLALGGMTRSPLRTPANWSIEKLIFESVPPPAAGKGLR